jgi:peptidoglycan glycosyltransferase
LPSGLRALAFAGFLGLVALGLLAGDGITDARWLAILGSAWLLLIVASWVRLPRGIPAFNRAVIRTALVVVTVFALLSVQMVRIQLVRSQATSQRTVVAPDGEVIANPRRGDTDLAVRRGRVFDADGTVLADTVRQGDAWARVYPEPESAPVVGYYSPLRYGTAGLEASFDGELSGDTGGNALARWENALLHRPQQGLDLHLTLDAELQREAARLLDGRNGAAVLIEVETGRVLAMASEPSFDPNALFAVTEAGSADSAAYFEGLLVDPDRPLVQRATLGQFTPGSIFKVVTAAASIEAGFSTPDTVFEDDGSLDVQGRVIVENDNRPDAAVTEYTLTEALAYSLNVVFAQVGLALGDERLTEYAAAFGFDGEVPFDLPVAPSQLASSPDFLESLPALAETAFGQGQLLVSPLHMAVLAAGIANDGTMMRPYLVERVSTRAGETTRSADPEVWRTPISEETAAQVETMMVASVETGIASGAQIPGLRVGGKTGTAETGEGTPPHAWFIGFAGDPEPRYAVSVVIENGGPGAGSLFVGRDLLAAAIARDAAPESATVAQPSAGGATPAPAGGGDALDAGAPANVRGGATLLLLKMIPLGGRIGHAVNAPIRGRSRPTTALRAAGRPRPRRASRRGPRHAGQRRGGDRGRAQRGPARRQRG